MNPQVGVQQARREVGPITDRGQARRLEMVQAARRVFERVGFVEARVADIAAEARVSHGTFYTYFETKEAAFVAASHAVIEEMLESMAISIPVSGLEHRVHDSISRFVDAYAPHARMIGLMEQVATFSPEMRGLRLEVRDTFVRRTRRGIERMKSEGLTREDLDVEYTAESLGAMLEYACYLRFCLHKAFSEDRFVSALARIWLASLRPATAPGDPTPTTS